MKRILMISVGLAVALCARSQADVTSAYNANKQGDFAKAAEYIDKAINDPKAAGKEKTWRYRGDIYLNIVGSPDVSVQFPNAAQICKESYFKALELDTKQEYLQETKAGLGSLQSSVLTMAGKQYESSDFCGAYGSFAVTDEISKRFGIVDSAAIYNAATCAERCGKMEEALAGYQESAKIGYNVPLVYSLIVNLYNKLGKPEEANRTLSEARSKFPKDAELLRAEVNVYLVDKKYDKALGLLKDLTAQDPSNEMIWFVLGVTYENLGKIDEQEAAYTRALEINPKYFDALFNLGALYYNIRVNKLRECDNIPPREQAKSEACLSEANKSLNRAIGSFEKAYAERPTDKDIITALKEAYVRVGNFEGKKKMEEALSK